MLRINQRSRNNEAVGIIVNPLDENANSKVTSEQNDETDDSMQ